MNEREREQGSPFSDRWVEDVVGRMLGRSDQSSTAR